MLKRIFNPENWLFQSIAKVVDVFALSLIWLLICLPIFTIGAATTALYDTVFHCVRQGKEQPYLHFFRCFRANFKVSTIATVLLAVLWFFLVWGYRIMQQMAVTQLGVMMFMAYYVMMIVPLGITCWLFPILSRFTHGVGSLFLVSAKIALRHLPSTIVISLLVVEMVLVSIQYWAPMLLAPAITALIWSLFIERIFKKYTPAPQETPEHVEQP